MSKLADLLEEHLSELALLESLDAGTTLQYYAHYDIDNP
jgi:acyl-CoA reductase-like NAD-dependent aldehyde dehydrogenase